jgi:lysozyme family protein
MATYQAFKIVKQKTEGYLARLANDTGGLTYQGIAKNFHPNWAGWPIIDFQISMNPTASDSSLSVNLKQNTYLESLVDSFYLQLWNRIGASALSQDVANIYMDYYIHKPADAVRTMQQVLNKSFGENLTIDSVPGLKTNRAVLRHDSAKLYNAYRKARLGNYQAQQYSSPTFWASWVTRVKNNFPIKGTSTNYVAIGGGLLLTAIAIYKLQQSSEQQEEEAA